MSDSTSDLDQLLTGQSGKEASINELLNATSPSSIFGRRAATTALLTWGYYGGRWGGIHTANGTVTLTASSTNYIVRKISDGTISVATTATNWNDTNNYQRLYKIVTDVAGPTSYEDHRGGQFGVVGIGQPAYAVTTANFTQPAVSSSVSVSLSSTAWMIVGMTIYLATGGFYTVASISGPTSASITNTGASGNASPGATISSGSGVGAGGPQGPAGSGGLSTNVAFNGATAFDAFGDSITAGVGASVSANAYANLLATRRALSITNHAVSGDMVADQADDVYALAVGNGQQSTLMLGTNDQRTYTTNTYKQSAFKRGHMALLAWLALPSANKVLGTAGSFTGTWSNATVYGGAQTKRSDAASATATYTVYGTVVYLATILQNSNNATFSVSIDGVNKGTFSCQPGGSASITSVNGLTYMPGLIRFAGLSEGAHTVVVTVVTATASTTYVYVSWVAGNNGASTKDGPNVFVGNVPRFTSAGYTASGGSDATVATFNAMIRQNVNQLAADGLQITLADSGARINPSTDLGSDGVHPNDTGHDKIAQAFQEAMNQIGKPAFGRRAPQSHVQVNTQTGTTYKLAIEDAGKAVRISNGAAQTLTIPTHDEVPFEFGEVIPVREYGAGALTVVGDTGVTLNKASTITTFGQHTGCALHKIGPNEWDLI